MRAYGQPEHWTVEITLDTIKLTRVWIDCEHAMADFKLWASSSHARMVAMLNPDAVIVWLSVTP